MVSPSQGEADATMLGSPNTYAILLPPEWIRVSLDRTVDDAVHDITDRMFRHVPRDAVLEGRREVEELLRGMIREARAGNGLDLYLPVEQMHGRTVAASFVVGGVVLDDDLDDLDSVALLGDLAQTGKLVEVDGALAVRTERVEMPQQAQGAALATRRVDYTIPIPEDTRRWLTVTFSTPGAGDPGDQVAEALVELFDAMMGTFRWGHR